MRGSGQHPYAQIAARLREDIAAGRYPLGGLLPTEKALAAQHGVARATIGHALDVLRADGIIVTIKGVGSRVASVPLVDVVILGPGDWAVARLAADGERATLGLGPGGIIVEVYREGAGGELHDAAVTRISCGAR